MIHRYTWRRREDGGEKKSLIDYIAVDERLRKDVMEGRKEEEKEGRREGRKK